MAVSYTNAANTLTHYHEFSTVPLSALGFTIAAWVYPTNTADNDFNICQIQDTGATGHYIRFSLSEIAGAGVTGHIQMGINDLGAGSFTNCIAWSTAQVTYNKWNHAAGTVTDNSNRAAFLNGGNKGTRNTGPYEPTWANLNSTSISGERDSTPDDGWDGRLAHIAVWNTVLADAEIALLAKGFPHHLMRPNNLKFYVPLDHIGTQRDWISGVSGTETGTPTTAEGPHIWSMGGVIVPRYSTVTNTTIEVPPGPPY